MPTRPIFTTKLVLVIATYLLSLQLTFGQSGGNGMVGAGTARVALQPSELKEATLVVYDSIGDFVGTTSYGYFFEDNGMTIGEFVVDLPSAGTYYFGLIADDGKMYWSDGQAVTISNHTISLSSLSSQQGESFPHQTAPFSTVYHQLTGKNNVVTGSLDIDGNILRMGANLVDLTQPALSIVVDNISQNGGAGYLPDYTKATFHMGAPHGEWRWESGTGMLAMSLTYTQNGQATLRTGTISSNGYPVLTSQNNASNLSFTGNVNHSISIGTNVGNIGRDLTVVAGSGNGTDKIGGKLILSGGTSTGNAGSVIELMTAAAGAGTGSVVRNPVARLRINANGDTEILGKLTAGLGASSSGVGSFALGNSANAEGNTSIAFGSGAAAVSADALAIGTSAGAIGGASIAIGALAGTQSDMAVAVGHAATAGSASVSIGSLSSASGATSVAVGMLTQSPGEYASAFGSEAFAAGYQSTALGSWAQALGDSSISIGGSQAVADSSVAIGPSTTYGLASFASGIAASTEGLGATAIGRGTIAKGLNQVVIGQFNVPLGTPHNDWSEANAWDPQDPIFIIGNGQNSSNRSNAVVVKKNGDMEVAGVIRIQPAGDISMGEFTAPPPASP